MQTLYTQLYTKIIRLRLVEEYIAKEYAAQEMRCPIHLCLGQEAVSVGIAHALKDEDSFLGTHRSHGPYVASGACVEAMILELYGKSGGCCHGRGGSMHLMAAEKGFLGGVPIVGSSIAIATGTAFAHKMKNDKRVSMVLFGEGATEEGVFYESLQFAVLKQLPIVYVCENNGFSVNTPYEQRRPKHIKVHELVRAQGVQVVTAQGDDVFAVHGIAQEAVAHARRGDGPVFLEFETYRYREHCGPGDDHHMPWRSKDALACWKARDPVDIAEKTLLQHGVAQKHIHEIYAQEEALIQQYFENAKKAPFPQKPASLGVYAE